MDKTELKVDDWILCDMYNPEDQFYPPGSYGAFRVRPQDFTNGLIERYLPMELTESILLLNGFKKYFSPYKELLFEFNEPFPFLIIKDIKGDWYLGVEIYLPNKVISKKFVKFKYVHELQHFLADFGVDKKIIVEDKLY